MASSPGNDNHYIYTWLVFVPILCVKVVYNSNCCLLIANLTFLQWRFWAQLPNLITANIPGYMVVVAITRLCRFYGVYIQVSSSRTSCALHLGYH